MPVLDIPQGLKDNRSALSRIFELASADPSLSFAPVRRSMRIHGHSTTIRLESAYWRVLEDLAEREESSVVDIVTRVGDHCPVDPNNLASCLRVICLLHISANR